MAKARNPNRTQRVSFAMHKWGPENLPALPTLDRDFDPIFNDHPVSAEALDGYRHSRHEPAQ